MPARTPRIALTALFALALAAPAAADDFASELDALVSGFPGACSSEDQLEALKERADALEDRMRDHRRAHRKEWNDAQKAAFEKTDDDVDALKGAIRVVGQLSNSASMSVEDFDRATRLLGAEPKSVREVSPEITVIQLDVGAYRSVLLRNGTKRNHTVQYAYRTPSMERPQGGVGSARCSTVTVLSSRLNSRDHDLEGLAFEQFTARPMVGAGATMGNCD